jgi:p-aminobenzoyl-glutamate transporter AbgT
MENGMPEPSIIFYLAMVTLFIVLGILVWQRISVRRAMRRGSTSAYPHDKELPHSGERSNARRNR